ncbi:MAG: aminoacetone oxidase family FAD-binding enzyme [Oscillospiraceae bacterium]|jgi:predicted Rossmann fold flavoprotein|nr:aminoacetone oxidase family FAD-binding enzyme [Oscillospiraceae bacterium]
MAEMIPLVIIGAGASGLMAAATASLSGPVLLLEKEARAGRKLLATGNGRCNLLTLRPERARLHGGGADAAWALMQKNPPRAVLQRFEAMGLCWREEAEGRVYPASGQAGAVLDVLRAACERQGVRLRTGAEVLRLDRAQGGFRLHLADGEMLLARRVIMAGGGRAAPSFGADGQVHRLLGALGHPVTRLAPALSPLKLPPDRIRGLKGVRTQATLALEIADRPAATERGEALFTDYGISGVAAMQLSRRAGEALASGQSARLAISLMTPEEASDQTALRASLFSGATMEGYFTGLLHKRIGLCLLREAGLAPDAPVTPDAARRVQPLLARWALPITGVLPFAHAQVTAGGLAMAAFCPETLESRLVPGLFACGEALDVDGDCGGYNLLWAWVSGMVVGEAGMPGMEGTLGRCPRPC